MNGLIKRNSPILIIGTITLIILLAIIFLSRNNSPESGPVLTETENLIAAHTYTIGPDDALVTLVEFSDFECPACQAFHPIVQTLHEAYPDHLRIAYRHFPLPQHPYARKAAEASQIAGEYGKFWEYSDMLFDNNTQLADENLLDYAEMLGINRTDFEEKLKSGTYAKLVNEDLALASKLRLNSTPSFFLNGKLLKYTSPLDFENQVKNELMKYMTSDESEKSSSVYSEKIAEVKEASAIYEKVDTLRPAMEIKFTANGFEPKKTTAIKYQVVRFTNTIDRSITFYQPIHKFKQIEQEKMLQPGESFELRMTETKMWAYREKESDEFGQILVYDTQI